ncbi:hypothetical protein WJX74_003457 [Apatococcus lobatus]|uniref:Uncharacterized protein n=1 Tax=Apatococcus lobatus TaxID=904363 RepID=A0AAW1R126_9CHLO
MAVVCNVVVSGTAEKARREPLWTKERDKMWGKCYNPVLAKQGCRSARSRSAARLFELHELDVVLCAVRKLGEQQTEELTSISANLAADCSRKLLQQWCRAPAGSPRSKLESRVARHFLIVLQMRERCWHNIWTSTLLGRSPPA